MNAFCEFFSAKYCRNTWFFSMIDRPISRFFRDLLTRFHYFLQHIEEFHSFFPMSDWKILQYFLVTNLVILSSDRLAKFVMICRGQLKNFTFFSPWYFDEIEDFFSSGRSKNFACFPGHWLKNCTIFSFDRLAFSRNLLKKFAIFIPTTDRQNSWFSLETNQRISWFYLVTNRQISWYSFYDQLRKFTIFFLQPMGLFCNIFSRDQKGKDPKWREKKDSKGHCLLHPVKLV